MKSLITKQLQKIEKVLNTNEEWAEEFWIYKLEQNKNNIIIDIFDGDYYEKSFTVEIIEEITDVKAICNSIISYIYENEINSRQNYVSKTKGFNTRKIQSMSNWMGKGNVEKVSKINLDLVERCKTTIEVKSELDTYRTYVFDFLNVLDVLCPTWRLEKEIQKSIEHKAKAKMYAVKNAKNIIDDCSDSYKNIDFTNL